MTTLLVSDDGKRRCDENCYDAKHAHCDCLCEGLNHRCGLEQAATNVREGMGDEDGENINLPEGCLPAFDRIWLIKFGSGQIYGTCTDEASWQAAEHELRSWGAKNIRRVEL